MKYNLGADIEAREFTLHDAEHYADIEAWSNGSVKGTKLKPRLRVLETNASTSDNGVDIAYVGDYIVKLGNKSVVFSAKLFHATFKVADDSTGKNNK